MAKRPYVCDALQDLKKYFDSCNGDLDPETVKVRNKDTASEKNPTVLFFPTIDYK